jgi:hypothetical protein
LKVDVVVPIYYINEHFEENVKSWFEAIPINHLFLGIANKDKKVWKEVNKLSYKQIQIINHTHFKTLGGCLVDLSKRVKTKWCVFLHDDVKLPFDWFKDMMEYAIDLKSDVLESLKEPRIIEHINQAQSRRAYSGAQLIRSKMLKYIDYEDDYVYCTEDLIFQARVLTDRHVYTKVPVLHQHQNHSIERTVSREDNLKMHIMALVKYLPPLEAFQNQIITCLKELNSIYKNKKGDKK